MFFCFFSCKNTVVTVFKLKGIKIEKKRRVFVSIQSLNILASYKELITGVGLSVVNLHQLENQVGFH